MKFDLWNTCHIYSGLSSCCPCNYIVVSHLWVVNRKPTVSSRNCPPAPTPPLRACDAVSVRGRFLPLGMVSFEASRLQPVSVFWHPLSGPITWNDGFNADCQSRDAPRQVQQCLVELARGQGGGGTAEGWRGCFGTRVCVSSALAEGWMPSGGARVNHCLARGR